MQPMPPDVKAAFEAFPPAVRHRLAEVRAMVFAVAGGDARIGPVRETLKWGEPAYLTGETLSGSTVRLGRPRARPDHVAIYFNCGTTLVRDFRDHFGSLVDYEGKRAVLVPLIGELPLAAIELMLAATLTYHRTKKTRPLPAAPI